MTNREFLSEAKYRKVKQYYFDKDTQVQQLQNTLAHQRLSLSRTSLDDAEYSNRFSRLDGAIKDLAFNIRKEWQSIPPWLQPVVNKDAISTGTKEMTAVGRACISHWIMNEVLDRYFHPALEPGLSTQLKNIERNVRRFTPTAQTDEEKDAALAKISNWRLTTLDGLADVLAAPQAAEYRASLTITLVEKLTAALHMNLKDPPPPGIEGWVTGIVELAVGLAANLPQESREVTIEYFMPFAPVNDTYMKMEQALPPLSTPIAPPSPDSLNSLLATNNSNTSGVDPAAETTPASTSLDSTSSTHLLDPKDEDHDKDHAHGGGKKKSGMFGGLMKTKTSNAGIESPRGSVSGQGGQGAGAGEGKAVAEGVSLGQNIRFSSSMAVEVRGRQVLAKATVYC